MLTIARGQTEGRQYRVALPEVHVGRTPSGNQVVLPDVGVSRRHATLVERDGEVFVRDAGSANGTLVNGEAVAGERALSAGDALAVGPVVLAFMPLPSGTEVRNGLEVLDAAGQPVIVPQGPFDDIPTVTGGAKLAAKLAALPTEAVALPPAVVTAEPEPPVVPRGTPPEPAPVADTMPPSGEPVIGDATQVDLRSLPERANDEPPPGQATTRMRVDAALRKHHPELVETDPVAAVARRPAADVEVARMETDVRVKPYVPRPPAATPLRRARQWRSRWARLEARKRSRVWGLLAVLVAVLGGAGVWWLATQRGRAGAAEPDLLGGQPLRDSFGWGAGVDHPNADLKWFSFDFISPTDAIAVVHFAARDIDPDEVQVVVNGVHLGWVPPDVQDPDRELEWVVLSKHLKRNERNTLVFDNVKNPPGEEPWAVAGLWVEVVPVPELPVEELHRRAAELARVGRELSDLRDVSWDNLFRSWRAYRQAWLLLTALPDGPSSEVYRVVEAQVQLIGRELDQRCRGLTLELERSMHLGNTRKARLAFEEAQRYFPTPEHRCHNQMLEKRYEYGL